MNRSGPRPALTSVARAGWLITPGVIAGLSHVAILKTGALKRLAIPLDGGVSWGGKPLLGPNKTWRGLLVMTAFAALVAQLQSRVARTWPGQVLGVAHDLRVKPWVAGGMMGLTYGLAELPNSF